MSTAAKAIGMHKLKRRALSLGMVKSFDYATQFLLPVVLARCLDSVTFGEYRLLWLVVGTAMIVTLNMGGTLYFFVPRSEPRKKRVHIHNAMVFLALGGLACGLALGPWNPVLPAALAPLERYGALVPAFVALWVAAFLMDYLPAIEERIGWQAFATVSVTALRVLLVAVAAWATGDLRVILWVMLALGLVKLALLLGYVRHWHGLGRPWFDWRSFRELMRHAAPFGVSNTLYSLRGQCDQWVAASLFAISSFAAFSIAAIIGQVVHVFRQSVMEAFMPAMSRMEATGDAPGMLEMNSRANVLVGRLLYPVLAFAFVFAEDIIRFVYTASYAEAAPVMRIYIIGMAAMVIEISSVMQLLQQGTFALRVTAFSLVVSLAASWGAAHGVGLPGAAVGSVLGVYIDRVLMLQRVSLHTGISLGRLQDWRSLGRAAATAAACGALAWVLVGRLLMDAGTLSRLIAGAAILALPYGALQWGAKHREAAFR